MQEALDSKIRSAGFEPAAIRKELFTLCESGRTLEAVIAEFNNCSELLNNPSTNSCN